MVDNSGRSRRNCLSVNSARCIGRSMRDTFQRDVLKARICIRIFGHTHLLNASTGTCTCVEAVDSPRR